MLYTVIATLNGRAYTENLIRALARVDSSVAQLRIVVVDNASTDDTVQWLASLSGGNAGGSSFPILAGPAILIRNERNLGVSAAWNAGIRIALANNAEAILVCGNDTAPMPGTVERLIELVRSGILFVSGTQVPYATKEHAVQRGVQTDPLVAAPDFSFFMFHPVITQIVGNTDARIDLNARIKHAEQKGEIPAVCISPWQYGLFDERFFPAYFEDGDYHHRCVQSGIVCLRDPGAIFRHECSLTIRANPDIGKTNQETFRANAELFRRKWGGLPQEVGLHHARPGNVTDEQWSRMTASRPVEFVSREEAVENAKRVYGSYNISVGSQHA